MVEIADTVDIRHADTDGVLSASELDKCAAARLDVMEHCEGIKFDKSNKKHKEAVEWNKRQKRQCMDLFVELECYDVIGFPQPVTMPF